MPTPKKKTVKKPSAAKPAAKAPAKKVAPKAVKTAAKNAVKKAPAKKTAPKAAPKAAVKKSAPKGVIKKAAPKKVAAKTVPVKKAPVKKVVRKADPVRDLAVDLARLAADLHCTDVVVQDVTGHSPITRFMVLVNGVSSRQLKAVADQLEDLGASRGHPRYKGDADPNATWVVLDLVDIVVHLFEPAARSHYDLETLFPDAKGVKWQR